MKRPITSARLTATGSFAAEPMDRSAIDRFWRVVPLWRNVCVALVCVFLVSIGNAPAAAAGFVQDEDVDAEESVQPNQNVDVDPEAQDTEIQDRLLRILDSTDWYGGLQVRVEEGIVYLSGNTSSPERKQWATDLAQRTQDVVAVVNRIEPREPSAWDFGPAWTEVSSWFRLASQSVPYVLLAIALIVLTWLCMRATRWLAKNYLFSRMESTLLRQVCSNAIAAPILILGAYLILRIAGLTSLAVTILGGTGLMGLVVGIAFRDIAENFLASILISVERPFRIGDLIAIQDYQGFVQRVSTRGTLLMTFEGNHVQIPNAIIYKNTVINYSTNPNVRLEFGLGIGYDVTVSDAQELAQRTLSEHPAILADPKPVVLVEQLGAATVNLLMLFWTDGGVHSHLKVRSSAIRMVKQAFEKAGISMPDEAREIVFPEGVPVNMPGRQHESEAAEVARTPAPAATGEPPEQAVNDAEGGLSSEYAELEQQAEQSKLPDSGSNLLES